MSQERLQIELNVDLPTKKEIHSINKILNWLEDIDDVSYVAKIGQDQVNYCKVPNSTPSAKVKNIG